MTTSPPHLYSHYGLTLQSDLALPHLCPGDPAAAVDVTIRLGPIAGDRLGDAMHFRNWRADPDELLFHAFGIGRLLIANGSTIVIDRHRGATDAAVVSILLGTGISALLMQRRIIPMHACAIATDSGAILVIGRSGAGKSTMLGGLVAAGCTMLADDVTGIVIAPGKPAVARPAFPAMRLWTDSMALLEIDVSDKVQVREDIAKYYIGVANFHAEPMPVRAIVLLNSNNRTAVETRKVAMANRVEALTRYIHRKNFLRGFGLQQWAFDAMVRLAQEVDMVAISRPSIGATPELMARKIVDHFDIDCALQSVG